MATSRRFGVQRIPRHSLPAALLLAAVLVALQRWHPGGSTPEVPADPVAQGRNESPASRGDEPHRGRVLRVVDGDTIILAESKERVRLIGADTPETVKPEHPVEPWGPEAAQFTRAFLATDDVRLEFDGPHRDKYGRLLAYVWVGDRMLNEELLRAGLARAELKYRYSAEMKERFQRAQHEAKAARRGIWSGNRSEAGR